MPVNKNSYQNGKVYRIWSLDTEDIYIGSSCDTLSNRFCSHKISYKLWKEGKGAFYSSFNLFDQVGVENCKIELIKDFPCNSKVELNREEGRIMRENKDIIVNKYQAGRTKKEYDEEYNQLHKEQIKEKAKEYYEQNKEYHKDYYQQNKGHKKEHMKKYREEHKEELAEKKRVYREVNKEKNIKKYDCECGGKYTHQSISIHEKTQRHQEYIKSR